jgi:hypothetical protein
MTKSLQDQKYEALKAHAEEKLEEANKEIENIARSQVPVLSRNSQGFASGSALIWLSWSGTRYSGWQKLPTKIE